MWELRSYRGSGRKVGIQMMRQDQIYLPEKDEGQETELGIGLIDEQRL